MSIFHLPPVALFFPFQHKQVSSTILDITLLIALGKKTFKDGLDQIPKESSGF